MKMVLVRVRCLHDLQGDRLLEQRHGISGRCIHQVSASAIEKHLPKKPLGQFLNDTHDLKEPLDHGYVRVTSFVRGGKGN